jgi:hypothetical protein
MGCQTCPLKIHYQENQRLCGNPRIPTVPNRTAMGFLQNQELKQQLDALKYAPEQIQKLKRKLQGKKNEVEELKTHLRKKKGIKRGDKTIKKINAQ